MARKNIAREYFFGVATPVGYTKKGQLPQRRASEDGGSRLHSLQFRRSHVQLFVVGISLLALIYVLPSAILAWTVKEA